MPDLADVKLWLASMSVRGVLEYLWAQMKALVVRGRASFVALAKTSAVWLAAGFLFGAGVWVGHIAGAPKRKVLRAEIVSLTAEVEAQSHSLMLSGQREDKAAATIKDWKAKYEALQAEKHRGATIPAAKPKTPPAPRKSIGRGNGKPTAGLPPIYRPWG